ncbi:hypothetical protein BD309DRAFT_407402 [Dichomitus squalens]|nr:hypothetical protein BD309DRAFT_407402 [Dichomitus squalens]
MLTFSVSGSLGSGPPSHVPLMSRPTISISTNQKDHMAAAKALTSHLSEWGITYGFIGGFAWSLLGSSRPTDISHFSNAP